MNDAPTPYVRASQVSPSTTVSVPAVTVTNAGPGCECQGRELFGWMVMRDITMSPISFTCTTSVPRSPLSRSFRLIWSPKLPRANRVETNPPTGGSVTLPGAGRPAACRAAAATAAAVGSADRVAVRASSRQATIAKVPSRAVARRSRSRMEHLRAEGADDVAPHADRGVDRRRRPDWEEHG